MPLELLHEKHPFLKLKQELYKNEYSPEKLKQISDEMLQCMKLNKGIGLAANQVGININMFIMLTENSKLKVVINPEIVSASNHYLLTEEGCLSFPKLQLNIHRPISIDVKYMNILGEQISETLTDIDARCFLHEAQHLMGITFDTQAKKKELIKARMKRAKETGKL